jgi:glycosyltransferase involved in cell wall biosynthesis
MRLLIVTQKVDRRDPILGFFHRWLEEFAKHCEKLTVICLERGECNLPQNIKVLSLGKENKASRWQYVYKFYQYIWQERKNYDAVFVHMNVEYIILGGIFWKIMRKKISLWYMHKSVTWRLKLAEKFTNFIFTGSKESFRLPSKKLHILHHGIDKNIFSFSITPENNVLDILSISRISAIKQIDLMLDLVYYLKNKLNNEIILKIVGVPITKQDNEYLKNLKIKINNLNLNRQIIFIGPVSNDDLVHFYQEADIFLNFSQTGSLDKTILEAASCGTLVISSNDSARDILPKELFVDTLQVNEIADKIEYFYFLDMHKKIEIKKYLHDSVTQYHSLDRLITNILSYIFL